MVAQRAGLSGVQENGKKRGKMRPGLEFFLTQVAPYYEIVLWASDPENFVRSREKPVERTDLL